jgi:hypothetical protein
MPRPVLPLVLLLAAAALSSSLSASRLPRRSEDEADVVLVAAVRASCLPGWLLVDHARTTAVGQAEGVECLHLLAASPQFDGAPTRTMPAAAAAMNSTMNTTTGPAAGPLLLASNATVMMAGRNATVPPTSNVTLLANTTIANATTPGGGRAGRDDNEPAVSKFDGILGGLRQQADSLGNTVLDWLQRSGARLSDTVSGFFG